MPVKGAFDEDKGEVFSVKRIVREPKRKEQPAELISAIPPTPKRGEEEATSEETPRRMRLVILSAIAALFLVGGTTLYIVRPWDPEAYSTKATVEADTSMEGYPGERTYLSSQDHTEEAEHKAIVQEAQQYIDGSYAHLAQLRDKLDACYDDIKEYLARGYLLEDGAKTSDVVGVQSELKTIRERLSQIGRDQAGQVTNCKETLVLIGYLEGAADVLADAWSTAGQEMGDDAAVFDVRAILNGSNSDRGYDEWHELFENAYKG